MVRKSGPYEGSLQGPDAQVAEGDGAVVGLEKDRAFGMLGLLPVVARRIREVDVVLDDLAVEHDLHEPGIGGLLPRGVELRGAEGDVERLPLARGLRGVEPGRITLVDVVIDRLHLRPGVDAA